MRILSRYLFFEIVTPLLACMAGFIFLWVIYDMFDNFSDFIEAGAPWTMVADFYLQQLPRAIAIGLPVAVLLSSLYCVMRLSRSSEFVAMQACGISVMEIAAPFMLVGLISAALMTWFNWEWNPQSVRNREQILHQIKEYGAKKEAESKGQTYAPRQNIEARVYRSKDSLRLWFVHHADVQTEVLDDVEIIQLTRGGNDLWKYYVSKMSWSGRGWKLEDLMKVTYDQAGNATSRQFIPVHRDEELTETFAQVTDTLRPAEELGVPELAKHLRDNADFPVSRLASYKTYFYYRLSAGLSCVMVVLMALPFGLTASRRDLMGGFVKAMLLYLTYLTSMNLFTALGEGNRILPWVGGAVPVVVFTILCALLFWVRAVGREAPSLDSIRRVFTRLLS